MKKISKKDGINLILFILASASTKLLGIIVTLALGILALQIESLWRIF